MAINPEDSITAQQRTAALLAQLWEKNRPLVEERLIILRRALDQLKTGSLSADLHAEAASVAHKMAGTMGMFGLPMATFAARQLEFLLESTTPPAAEFATHLGQLEFLIATKDTKN